MDFRNRSEQSVGQNRVAPVNQPSTSPVPNSDTTAPSPIPNAPKSSSWNSPGWLRLVHVALLFSLTVLCLAVAYFLSVYNPNDSKYILDNKYQAVFLTNGQVYFGKIANINGRYVNLKTIFYLNSQSQTNQSTNNTSGNNQFTLVKLGCELHGPYDQMIINRSNVTFWENLQDNSQVVKSIKQWQQQNPNGQVCSSNSSADNTSQNNSSTNNSTTTTPTKKQ